MESLNIILIFGAVFLVQEVQAGCQDVDSVACGVLLKSDPQLCQKQCLADICRATCGFCPLKCYHCDSVDDPAHCKAQVQCQAVGEICIATQRFTNLLQPVFSSGCVNKAVCNTLFGNSNKRAYTLHGGCCSTDLCNDHDPDNTTVFDSVDDLVEDTFQVEDPPSDTCAAYDVSNVACGILRKTDPTICSRDCIGRSYCPETCGTCVRCKTCKDIDDPSRCSNITLCKSTQSCFTREHLRLDFSLGHDLQCMDDFICHAYFGGIQGKPKRQLGANIRLTGQCCKTNLCNQNGIQVITTPSTGR